MQALSRILPRLLPLFLIGMAACAPLPETGPAQPPSGVYEPTATPDVSERASRAASTFVEVVETMEPVAERECRRVAPGANCNFIIVIDDRPGQAPNAFQTLDRAGRPVLAFNLALIASVENADELAFVMGHEASHHILGHLERTQQNAAVGAVIFSGLAAMSGASAEYVREAEQIGAQVGARRYSKDFELEADQLGTIITAQSGYDPVRGAEFFLRIPDPGNRFLGTHPPNAARIDIVRQTAARLGV
ncbi:Peptidase family M48 [Roseivivax sp. THAF40]|uniref:M48 family metallopeptidase n=1 Tax=unclassified Roseivivax TaxID=2639302 RepID=UPI0012A7AD94|nr:MULTISPECIES: M48 family metallopeptidase [unclassified Roseivivax]QFS81300.1 Peptidase family M48 [Roseivivax sp. THAF197b]QFT45029.1 Peptidase family M48 [Roseivivax sp. THAF40]